MTILMGELESVRCELRSLLECRNSMGTFQWTEAYDDRYRELCMRERVLLTSRQGVL